MNIINRKITYSLLLSAALIVPFSASGMDLEGDKHLQNHVQQKEVPLSNKVASPKKKDKYAGVTSVFIKRPTRTSSHPDQCWSIRKTENRLYTDQPDLLLKLLKTHKDKLMHIEFKNVYDILQPTGNSFGKNYSVGSTYLFGEEETGFYDFLADSFELFLLRKHLDKRNEYKLYQDKQSEFFKKYAPSNELTQLLQYEGVLRFETKEVECLTNVWYGWWTHFNSDMFHQALQRQMKLSKDAILTIIKNDFHSNQRLLGSDLSNGVHSAFQFLYSTFFQNLGFNGVEMKVEKKEVSLSTLSRRQFPRHTPDPKTTFVFLSFTAIKSSAPGLQHNRLAPLNNQEEELKKANLQKQKELQAAKEQEAKKVDERKMRHLLSTNVWLGDNLDYIKKIKESFEDFKGNADEKYKSIAEAIYAHEKLRPVVIAHTKGKNDNERVNLLLWVLRENSYMMDEGSSIG